MQPRSDYLDPYLQATAIHGGGFGALLWASPQTQAARFKVMSECVPFRGKSLLDLGCGRADLLQFLVDSDIPPAVYTGVEAICDLADVAERRIRPGDSLMRDDFVQNPACMLVGARVVAVSGSLNTVDDTLFYDSLAHAYNASGEWLVFNFLSSPMLAGASYLYWRRPGDVLAFARSLGGTAFASDSYLPGDMTIAIQK